MKTKENHFKTVIEENPSLIVNNTIILDLEENIKIEQELRKQVIAITNTPTHLLDPAYMLATMREVAKEQERNATFLIDLFTRKGRDKWGGIGLERIYGFSPKNPFHPCALYHDSVAVLPGRTSQEQNTFFYRMMLEVLKEKKILGWRAAYYRVQAEVFYRLVQTYTYLALEREKYASPK